MSTGTLEPPTPAFPAPVVVGNVHADPHAARRLARAYRDAAASAEQARRDLRAAVNGLPWTGAGAQARWAPAEAVDADLRRSADGLRDAATSLERYARELEKARAHHGWSLKKLAVLGAVVVVTAAAVTVTMGAAAVAAGTAEAALAEGALAGAGAAVAAASTAEASAAASLLSSAGLMTGLRVLGTFVLPKLAQAEVAGGLSALQQEAVTGRLSSDQVLLDMQLGLVGSSAAGLGVRALHGVELSGVAGTVAPHLVVGGAVAGTSALGQWESGGGISAERTVRDGVVGGYFSALGWTIARGASVSAAREPGPADRWGWNGEGSLDQHFRKHGSAMGFPDAGSYAEAARDLWRRAESGELAMGYSARHNSVVVFDPQTSVFATFSPSGLTRTMFIPTDFGRYSVEYARSYWLRNVDRFL